MSRTRKGSKPSGWEFWGRRPQNIHGDKTLTCRTERRIAKAETAKELREVLWP